VVLSQRAFFQSSKCHNLRISRKRFSLQREYNSANEVLEIVEFERDLGVTISMDTSWSQHINIVVSTANQMLGFLQRNCGGILNIKALKLLYMSLVRSHLYYCSQLWAPQTVIKDLLLIENVQIKASNSFYMQGLE
jgi:hypothetical protein